MLAALVWTVAALAGTAIAVYKYFDGNGDYWTKRGVASPKRGELATFWQRATLKVSIMEYDTRIYNHFKDQKFFGLVEFREPSLYIRDLELIKKVLVKDFDHFVDRRKIALSDSDLFSKMLILKTGKEWKELRSVMSPTFTTVKIKRMFAYFNICADQFANHLRQKDSQEVEFQDEFGRFTASVIASIVFGVQTDVFTNEKSQFMKMAKKMQDVSITILIKFFLLIIVPKLAKGLNLSFSSKEVQEYFSAIIKRSIQERREGSGEEKRQDFLQMMLEVQAGQNKMDEKELENYEKDARLKDTTAGTGKKDLDVVLDDETVIAQAFLFFTAGFDSVQTGLTFATYEIAVNPDVQERLAEEIIPIMEKNDGALTYESVNEMAYLDMVVSETLRKNPPSILTERQCTADYKVPETDVVIPKGMRIVIPINAVHHDENYYPDPEKFNPENFNAENKAKRHPYAYLPFGLGPRSCIAMRFALVETKAAIAHLIYNFKIEPCEKTVIPMVRSPKTAKPVSCCLRFQPRRSNAN